MNDMKKIMNDWRNLLKEDMGMPQNQPEQVNNSQEVNTLQNLVKQHYPEFVSGLNQLVQDKNFLNFLRKQDPNNPNNSLNIKWSSYRCSDLMPMQNIIGLDDSLAFEFKKPDKTREKASGKLIGPESYDFKSRPIITCGKYIIDGHHRWSTVYMLNPQTSIKVRDITNFRDGTSGLKASQLIIAAMKGKVPISSPKGINVFTEDMKNISIWLAGYMTPAFIVQYLPLVKSQTFNKIQEAKTKIARNSAGSGMNISEKQMCVNRILQHINILREKNAPQGAATTNPRTIMPQYSDDSSELEAATSGKINVKAIKGALGAVNEVATTGQPIAGQQPQTPTADQTQAAAYAKTRMTNDRAGVEQEISSGGLDRYKTNPQEARAAINQSRALAQQWRKQQGNPVANVMAAYFDARAVAITALQQQGAKEKVQNTPQQQVLPGLGQQQAAGKIPQ